MPTIACFPIGNREGDVTTSDVASRFFAVVAARSPGAPFVSSEVDLVMDGRPRTIKYMRTRLTNEDRYAGTLYVFEDLTELISSKKLAAWVEMARQIAHEIKNPLTPIKLSTQFMVRAHEERAKDFDKIFRESSDTIIKQVDVLRHIASEFSSFGRLQQLDLVSKKLAPELESIVGPYRRNVSGVDVVMEPVDEDIVATFDPEALRKICTNLIENAMEAMPDGGTLNIRCARRNDGGPERVEISFRDTGSGLDDEVRHKLFEPYFSTKTTGTGLGLAICRTLSREMGGDVVVSNASDGPGVEATLFLPV